MRASVIGASIGMLGPVPSARMGVGIGNHLLRHRRWLTGDVDDDLAAATDLDLRNLKASRLDGFDRATDFNGLELPITAAHGRDSTSNDLKRISLPAVASPFSSALDEDFRVGIPQAVEAHGT